MRVKLNTFTSFILLGSLLISIGCSEKSPNILLSCERDKDGNYILKWECYPIKPTDKVSVYMSDNEFNFPNNPIVTVQANQYRVTIPVLKSAPRQFFKLRVGNIYSSIVSNRFFKMDHLQNFRDQGGYVSQDGRQIKWGKIYRSGELTELSVNDSLQIEELQIKTIIDLRGREEIDQYPNVYKHVRIINIPISTRSRLYVSNQILEGNFVSHDAFSFIQKMYQALIEDNQENYKKVFDVLTEETNYPILIHGYLGKDRVGLVGYFLLRVLDVSHVCNEDDYLLSNYCIDKHEVFGEARYLPEQMQEAATTMCLTDVSLLEYAKFCMRKKSDTVDKYMTDELDLTPQKREKIRRILLYR